MMKGRVVIGTRGSRLAMIQANTVASELQRAHPATRIEIHKIVTEGDRNRDVSIDEAGGTGIFVRALEEALSDGRVDIAVHSLKDMPAILPADMYLAAVTQRIDPRDALVAGVPLSSLKPGARIGTGSLRRKAQLKHLRSDLEVIGIRGNVDSRLGKVTSGELDGVIVAAAAMLRLGWDAKITEYLPLESFLPAAGQGALAIETRKGDSNIEKFVSVLNHLPTWQAIQAERAFLHGVEAGCRAPVAALATVDGQLLRITAVVADKAGAIMIKKSLDGDPGDPEGQGLKLAKMMLDAGAGRLIKEMRCP